MTTLLSGVSDVVSFLSSAVASFSMRSISDGLRGEYSTFAEYRLPPSPIESVRLEDIAMMSAAFCIENVTSRGFKVTARNSTAVGILSIAERLKVIVNEVGSRIWRGLFSSNP
jgi:hypothetical protein